MTRPVYGITVLRYEDGRTEVRHALVAMGDEVKNASMPGAWEHRHRMLIDALELVKREANQE